MAHRVPVQAYHQSFYDEQTMASNVTIHSPPYVQIALPPICCYCLEPATTTYPVSVRVRKVRTGKHTRMTFSYPVQVPYCAAHGREARLFNRYDNASTIVLFVAGVVLWVLIELMVGRPLRTMGSGFWWCSSLILMILLAVGGAGIYVAGRKLLQRRYPALAGHYYTGSLGAKTAARVARRPPQDSDLILAVTFTFSNDDFAAQVAALHGTEAHPVEAL